MDKNTCVVHEVDSTARPQIVKEDNPFHRIMKYWELSDIDSTEHFI